MDTAKSYDAAELVPIDNHPRQLVNVDDKNLLAAWLDKYSHSPRTVEQYRASWIDFSRFFDSAYGIADPGQVAGAFLRLSRRDATMLVQRYRSFQLERGLAPATINARLTALGSLINYACHDACLIEWTLRMPRLKSEGCRDTRGPGRQNILLMLAEVESRGDAKGRRDAAILKLLHNLGLRRSEVTGLDLADLDLEAGTVAVKGKGKLEKRKYSLDDRTAATLAAWLEERGSDPGPLFLSLDRNPARRGKRLTGQGLALAVKAIGDAVGVKVRPHGLRHSAITSALDATNGDVRRVRRFSRHSKLETIQAYDDSRADHFGQVGRLVAV